jgi:hypothetical protein
LATACKAVSIRVLKPVFQGKATEMPEKDADDVQDVSI